MKNSSNLLHLWLELLKENADEFLIRNLGRNVIIYFSRLQNKFENWKFKICEIRHETSLKIHCKNSRNSRLTHLRVLFEFILCGISPSLAQVERLNESPRGGAGNDRGRKCDVAFFPVSFPRKTLCCRFFNYGTAWIFLLPLYN